MVKYYFVLSKRFIIVSWHKIRAFNFEFAMLFVNLLFNFSFVIIFWNSLLRHIPSFGDWNFPELALYSSIVFLGESIGGIFFGFRDLPQRIIGGGLDKFLVRPMNTLFAVLFEQVSVVYFLEQFIASIVLIIVILNQFAIKISFINMLTSFIVLVVGVVIFNCIYGMITFLAFWVGQVGVFRAIIFGLAESKQYPLKIFPLSVQFFLTFIIPIALVSYYPTLIFLGKMELDIKFFAQVLTLFVIAVYLFKIVWNKGLQRYEANGG